jgi:hypothetical protein
VQAILTAKDTASSVRLGAAMYLEGIADDGKCRQQQGRQPGSGFAVTRSLGIPSDCESDCGGYRCRPGILPSLVALVMLPTPEGCWNWFGYSYDDRYPLKDGVQVTAIYNMIQRVMGES